MSHIVMDTNILVSAFISPHGNSAKIMNMLFTRQLCLCYSSEILKEYKDVIFRPKFPFDPIYIKTVLERITKNGIYINPLPLNINFTDKADKKFYETAKFCETKLITGNLKHFPLDSDVLSPADFLLILFQK